MNTNPIPDDLIRAIAAALADDNLAGLDAPAWEPIPNQRQPLPPQLRAAPSTNGSSHLDPASPPRPPQWERGPGGEGTDPEEPSDLPEAATVQDPAHSPLAHRSARGDGGEGDIQWPAGTPQVPTAQVQATTATPEKTQHRALEEAVTAPSEPEPEPEPEPETAVEGVPEWCSALTKRGEPCIAFRTRTSAFCAGHDPARAEQRREAGSRGGRTTAERRRKERKAQDFIFESLTLADRTSLQEAIDAVFRLELAGKLPATRSRNVLRVLAIAARNLSGKEVPRMKRPGPRASLSPLNRDLFRALKAAYDEDRWRRASEISHESDRRRQMAKDIDDLPALDRRPAAARKLDSFPTSARDYIARYGG